MNKILPSDQKLKIYFSVFVGVQLTVSLFWLRNSPEKLYLPFYSWSHFTYRNPDPCVWELGKIVVHSVDGVPFEKSASAETIAKRLKTREQPVHALAKALRDGADMAFAQKRNDLASQLFKDFHKVEFEIGFAKTNFKSRTEEFQSLKAFEWTAP